MRNFIAIAIVLTLFVTNVSATSVWLSDNGTSSSIPAQGDTPMFMPNVGASNQVMYVWAQPDDGETLQNISLNLRASTPGVVEFTGIELTNGHLGNTGPLGGNKDVFRYEFINDSGGGLEITNPNEIINFQGFTVANDKVLGLGMGAGSADLDPDYDADNNTWKLATVTYNNSAGHTDLWLEIGPNGLNNSGGGSADTGVIFGDADEAPLNGESDRETPSSRPDGSVWSVPEPGTWVILVIGAFTLLPSLRRRAA